MTQIKKMVFLDPDAPCEDVIDSLLNRLDTNDASDSDLVFRVHRNVENGNFAIFPTTAKNESDWQERALAMHSQQVPITVADKPSEIVPKYHEVETQRGD